MRVESVAIVGVSSEQGVESKELGELAEFFLGFLDARERELHTRPNGLDDAGVALLEAVIQPVRQIDEIRALLLGQLIVAEEDGAQGAEDARRLLESRLADDLRAFVPVRGVGIVDVVEERLTKSSVIGHEHVITEQFVSLVVIGGRVELSYESGQAAVSFVEVGEQPGDESDDPFIAFREDECVARLRLGDGARELRLVVHAAQAFADESLELVTEDQTP